MRPLRFLLALVALAALLLSGQACLLQGQHVAATQVCGDHADDDAGHRDEGSRCQGCATDGAGIPAPAALSLPIPQETECWTLLGALAAPQLLAQTAPVRALPPDPAVQKRMLVASTRALPARGPDLLG